MTAAQKKESVPTLKDESILSFQLERWTDVSRNRHHIMSRLAKGNMVLFASPPFYIRDVLSASSTGVSKISNDLYSYIPPRWLPYNYRSSKLDELTRELRVIKLKGTMSKLRMTHPILYIWYPSFVDMVGKFDESLVVYHIYDEYASFPDQTAAENEQIIQQEKELLKLADIVFVTSEVICARKRVFNSNIHVVTNAVDEALFFQEGNKIPEDINSIPGPIIGCVTSRTTNMDLPLLREIFQLRPSWSFVVIGIETRYEDPARIPQLLDFQRLPNVHFIGRRPISAIPAYLEACDVCVIPWIINDKTLSGSPLKLYEYLAAGKPVVSKPFPFLSDLSNVVSLATDPKQWIAAIEDVLQQNSAELVKQRRAIALQNTWDQRAAFIATKLAEELSRRR